ncbi:MAG: HipA N-terminal domain-containing protein [Flavobacteriales bacterium]|nr:HipA N-terminal domain-containing protein [Flavobacteriales bacterium]
MLKKIKKILLPTDQQEYRVDKKMTHHFVLKLGSLDVGYLSYSNGKWSFEYTQAFKDAAGVKTLANFPDIEKRYTSDTLWPFFAARIPSLSRKRVLKRANEKGIDKQDIGSLLKLFGVKTLTNPFTLVSLD